MKFKRFPTYNHYAIWLTTCYFSPLYGTIQLGVLQKLCVGHGPYYYFEHVKHIIKRRLKRELKKFQHTIIMKFVRLLAIIVHYMVQFNSECCKSSVSNMGPNTI